MSRKEYNRRKNEYNKKRYKDKLKEEGKQTKQEQITEVRQRIKALINKGFKKKYILVELDLAECQPTDVIIAI